MKSSESITKPSLFSRIFSVWYRHMRVYTRHIISNGLPPFAEPLIFLAGIGLGLGKYITESVGGMPYIQYLGIGLLVVNAMWTSTFECTYGTFIRLEFEKVYDGMLSAPITTHNLIVGEIIWAGTKGFFFSFAVLTVLSIFGVVPLPNSLFAPFLGFFTAVMFACIGLTITSFVKTINHFTFFFTGIISPMMFFSGVVFPITNLPEYIQPFAYALPLTQAVRILRAVCTGNYSFSLIYSVIYIAVFIMVFSQIAVKRLSKRMVF